MKKKKKREREGGGRQMNIQLCIIYGRDVQKVNEIREAGICNSAKEQ